MPAPRKRESELQRPRERRGTSTTAQVTKGTLREVTIPRVDPAWHPQAKKFFNSLKTSGQADFYQDSDWAFAVFLADEITAYKSAGNRSAMMLTAILQGMERLLLTEGDRRKARIELTEPPVEETPAALIAINGYKAALSGNKGA